MKTFVRLAALAAAFAVAAPAAAQQRTNPPRFGLGVGLSQADAPLLSGTLLFVPLNVGPQFRIEPFIGFDRVNFDAPGPRASNFAIGAGAFLVNPVASQVQLYGGGRLALNFFSSRDPGANPDKSERTDFFIAGVLGGEYVPHPRIAVGAEAMVGYVAIGEEETTDGVSGLVTESPSGSEFATQGTLFVRVYLF
jgi:hypothetical protein